MSLLKNKLLYIACGLAILCGWYWNPLWIFIDLHSDDIRNIGLLLAATFALPLAFRRAKAHDKQAEASYRQVILATKTQSADIYSRAIEQLSNTESPTARIGGIYSLRKLASANKSEYLEVAIDNLKSFLSERGKEEIGRFSDNGYRYKQTPEDIKVAFT